MYQRKPPIRNSATNAAEETPAVIKTLLSRGTVAYDEGIGVSELIDTNAETVTSEMSFTGKSEVVFLAVVPVNAVFVEGVAGVTCHCKNDITEHH